MNGWLQRICQLGCQCIHDTQVFFDPRSRSSSHSIQSTSMRSSWWSAGMLKTYYSAALNRLAYFAYPLPSWQYELGLQWNLHAHKINVSKFHKSTIILQEYISSSDSPALPVSMFVPMPTTVSQFCSVHGIPAVLTWGHVILTLCVDWNSPIYRWCNWCCSMSVVFPIHI